MKVSDHSQALARQRVEAEAQQDAPPRDDGVPRHDVAFVGHPDGDFRYAVRITPNGFAAVRSSHSLGCTLIYDLTAGRNIKSRDGKDPSTADIERMRALPERQG